MIKRYKSEELMTTNWPHVVKEWCKAEDVKALETENAELRERESGSWKRE